MLATCLMRLIMNPRMTLELFNVVDPAAALYHCPCAVAMHHVKPRRRAMQYSMFV